MIANLIWGASPPISKWALQTLPLFTLAFLRFFIPAIMVAVVFPHKLRIRMQDFGIIVLATVLGSTVNILFFFLGLEKTASINSPIIGSSGPILLMIGAILFLREHPKKRQIFGNVLGFLGILIIVLQPLLQNHQTSSFIGNLFLIIATIGSVLGTILTKNIMKRNLPEAIAFWSFAIASISFFPFFYGDLTTIGFLPHLTQQGIIGLVFSIIFASTIAYSLYFWALKHATACETGLFTYIDPVVAILVAIPLLGEFPSITFLLGSFLVFIGIFIAEGRLPYHPMHKLFGK